MNAQKRVLLAMVAIGLLLTAALPALAQDSLAAEPLAEWVEEWATTDPSPELLEDAEAARSRPDLLRLHGKVVTIEDAGLALRTLDGIVRLRVNDRTRFRVPGAESPRLQDVHVGDLADVVAMRKVGGGLLAVWVRVRFERVRLNGDVTQVVGNNLKMQNPDGEVLVHTNGHTRFRVAGMENPTLADIQVGDHIHGFALKRGEGSLWGSLLMVVEEYKLRGQVTAIADGSITISQFEALLTFTTDDKTRFRVPGVEDATLADVQVGDLVGIVALGQEDGTILARGVAVLKGIRVQGQVAAKSGALVTVNTQKGPLDLLTDAETRYRVPGVESPTLDDVQVGDRVAAYVVSPGAGAELLAKGVAVLVP